MNSKKKTQTAPEMIWRPGFPNRGIAPQVAARELDKISKANGGKLKTVTVVKAAASPKSPIHPIFEWDDTKAAALFRKKQAVTLMGSLLVVYEQAGKQPIEVPYLVSYRTPETAIRGMASERTYALTETVKHDPELRSRVIERAWGELMSWESRYEHLSEFLGVRMAISKIRRAA